MVFVSLLKSVLVDGKYEPVVTVEVQLSPAVKLIISGSDLEMILGVLKKSIDSAGEILGLVELARTAAPMRERRIPQEFLTRVKDMSSKDLVLLLLYYEGPMSREQINQRSREIGKEVSKTWLNTEFFRKPTKDLFLSETDQSGAKIYRLSELGRLEAEKIIKQISEQIIH